MSGPKKYLRTESGERIDQPDFEHAAEESQLAGLTQLGETFIVGSDAGQKNYVLSGFKVTNPSANNLEISIGSGILSWKDQGNVEHGVMIDMTTARTVGLSTTLAGAGATTYGVYVSFNLQDAQQENRNFWNALAATPVEVTRQIATRRVDSLEVNIKASSPGTEWMHIADIVPGSLTAPGVGSTTGITDKRVFYFEGAVADSYDPTDDWGSVFDRSADRATYGLKGLRQFVRATQAQLGQILNGLVPGTADWILNATTLAATPPRIPTAGIDLVRLKNEAFSAKGSNSVYLPNTIQGDLDPDANATYDLGNSTTPRKWKDLYLSGTMSAATASSDTFQYNSTQTKTIFIPAFGGNGVQVNTGATSQVWRLVGDNATPESTNGVMFHTASSEDQPWIWNIGTHLPDGAIITSAQITTSPGTTAGAGANSVRLGLFRMDTLASTYESLKTGATPYNELTANSGTIAAQTLTIDEVASVRTITKATHAHCAWMSARGTANPNLVGALITYTYTVIAP
tara:strand:+ start:1718 stop:3262 length:1545 start_codon:yes stop_codon:yes gene_type:complete